MGNVYFAKTYQRSFGTFPLRGTVLADAIVAAVRVALTWIRAEIPERAGLALSQRGSLKPSLTAVKPSRS